MGGFDQGWAFGRDMVDRGVARQQELSDQDRQNQHNQLLGIQSNIQDQLKNFKDDDGNIIPEYKAQYDKLQGDLGQVQNQITQLWHPITAPGAIQRSAHFLLDKLNPSAPKGPSSTTTQMPNYSLPTTPAPLNIAALPEYQQTIPAMPSQGGPKTTTVPGVPASSLPGMEPLPFGATRTMVQAEPKGLVKAGNIPIWNRPQVNNSDGSVSSEYSASFQDEDGNEVLVPTVIHGKFMTPNGQKPEPGSKEEKQMFENAWDHYQQTGEHLGKFKTAAEADLYANALHNRQNIYPLIPASAPVTVNRATWAQGKVQQLKDQAMQQAQGRAQLLADSAPLSPQQTAKIQFRADEAVREQKIAATIKLADTLGLTDTQKDELKQELIGMIHIVPKAIAGDAGRAYKGADNIWYRPVQNPDGSIGRQPMPPDWTPQTKAIRGTLINTQQQGWIQTWVDPFNPARVVGWQKVTPGRNYQGSTTSRTMTDSAGVTSKTTGTTVPTNSAPVDFNLSGLEELPRDFNGVEGSGSTAAPAGSSSTPSSTAPSSKPGSPKPASPKGASAPSTTPAGLKKAIPAPPIGSAGSPPAPASAGASAPTGTSAPSSTGKPLDTDDSGHIPSSAAGLDGKPVNQQIREGANQLLDGIDIKDISLPARDKSTAEATARLYGWGRGPYLPRELKQMQNAKQFLDQALDSKPFMKAIDDGFMRSTQTAMAEKDASKQGIWGTLAHVAALKNLTPDQQEYLTIRQALMGTVSGLSSVVRTGRPTEATINRLTQEIPDVMSSSNSTMAKEKIKQIQKELDVALAQGVPAPRTKKDSQPSPSGGLSLDEFIKKHNLPPR